MAGKKDRAPLLPAAATAALKRLGLRLAGVILVFVGVALAFSLLTYSPADPSFNTATGAAPRNALGLPGSYVADMALQGLGLLAWVAVAGLAIAGGRLFLGRAVSRPAWRIVCVLMATVCLSAALDILPTPSVWPTDVGLGGGIGYLLHEGVALLVGATGVSGSGAPVSWLTPQAATRLVCLVLGVAGLLLLQLGFGVFRRSYRLFYRGLRFLWRWIRARRSPSTGRSRPGGRSAARAGARREPRVTVVSRVGGREDRVRSASPPVESSAPLRISAPVDRAAPTMSGLVASAGAASTDAVDTRDVGPVTLPPLRLLTPARAAGKAEFNEDDLKETARKLESVFADFGVRGQVVNVRPGPVVTLYEFVPAPGTKSARVIGLADDVARIMCVQSARIAALAGQEAIGVELANARRSDVRLHDILVQPGFRAFEGALPIVLGKTIGGDSVFADLAGMPHLLIAGTTGSGKSVALNGILLSLLYRLTPRDVRFILIDPKMLELSVYNGIPHLLAPVVTEPAKAVCALKWVVREMEDRYRAMNALAVRNIENYNLKVREAVANGAPLARRVQTGFEANGDPIYEEQIIDTAALPYIVVVVDEMADLMLTAGKDVEVVMQRLAQMARAAGIHIIMATQRPSVDVITGTIKANFPSRISFRVASKIDSRTILNEVGAEQLLGQGDMLYLRDGRSARRVHGPFVSDEEVEKVCRFLREQAGPAYIEAVTQDIAEAAPGRPVPNGTASPEENALFAQAVALVLREGRVSTSFVQRYLKIGYNRAATLVERMEEEGIVSRPNHAGKREVLTGRDEEPS